MKTSTLCIVLLLSMSAFNHALAMCTPVLQWVWEGAARSPGYPYTCATPLVVEVTDDNMDGSIDRLDATDVVFSHCGGLGCVITAVDGATGVEHFTTTTEVSETSIAAGDIDGDGIVEIVAINAARDAVLAFEHTGALKWTGDTIPALVSFDGDAVGIADLDQDGSPEIYLGATVFNADGSLRFRGTEGSGNNFTPAMRISNAAEIVADNPGLELVAGRTAYDAAGTIVWNNPAVSDGWGALGDLNQDGEPEIALTTVAGLFLLDRAGAVLNAPYGPVGFSFAAPLIADLNGDGRSEVFFIMRDQVQALTWSGTQFEALWTRASHDLSGLTGAAAYDFDGDGAREIVYHDERSWSILDGSTGAALWNEPMLSKTWIETPVVADIDNDCQTEILVGGCKVEDRIAAYECESSSPARSIWNQYSYHVTNVNDDGTIPRLETTVWTAGQGWLNQHPGDPALPVAEAGEPRVVCVGGTATLDGSASVACVSSGLQFRWLQGAAVACDWSVDPMCTVAPAATCEYTLEVACLGSPDCASTDTVQVAVAPDVRPSSVGNTLAATRSGDDVVLSWVAAPGALAYNVYRGTTKGAWVAPPVRQGIPPGGTVLRDVLPPPTLYFYRVVGVSCSGQEGP